MDLHDFLRSTGGLASALQRREWYIVQRFRDAGTEVHGGGTSPLSFERGATWHRCPYITVS